MNTIREELADWTEIESVIDVFAVAYGLLPAGERFPKAFYWATGSVVDILVNTIFKMVDAGILERRDDRADMELRWKPDYSTDWGAASAVRSAGD